MEKSKVTPQRIIMEDYKFLFFGIVVFLMIIILYKQFSPSGHCKVAYVSQQEILDLERARLNKISNSSDKQMFFGKPKEAANLVEEIALELAKDKNMTVVFSSGKVYGQGVVSLSLKVYRDVINELKNTSFISNDSVEEIETTEE